MDKRTRVLNHELDLTFPDSFRSMSKEELAGLQNPAGAEGAVFSDPDDHILLLHPGGFRTKKSGHPAGDPEEGPMGLNLSQSIQ